MQVWELKELLNPLPDNMEIVRDDGGKVYDRDIHFEIIEATVHSEELNSPTELTEYYREGIDDYWSVYRVYTKVLLIY